MKLLIFLLIIIVILGVLACLNNYRSSETSYPLIVDVLERLIQYLPSKEEIKDFINRVNNSVTQQELQQQVVLIKSNLQTRLQNINFNLTDAQKDSLSEKVQNIVNATISNMEIAITSSDISDFNQAVIALLPSKELIETELNSYLQGKLPNNIDNILNVINSFPTKDELESFVERVNSSVSQEQLQEQISLIKNNIQTRLNDIDIHLTQSQKDKLNNNLRNLIETTVNGMELVLTASNVSDFNQAVLALLPTKDEISRAMNDYKNQISDQISQSRGAYQIQNSGVYQTDKNPLKIAPGAIVTFDREMIEDLTSGSVYTLDEIIYLDVSDLQVGDSFTLSPFYYPSKNVKLYLCDYDNGEKTYCYQWNDHTTNDIGKGRTVLLEKDYPLRVYKSDDDWFTIMRYGDSSDIVTK